MTENKDYTPKATWRRCVICGEKLENGQPLIGGKVKGGGTRCAHRSCYQREQAERKAKA